jgi:peroxiredoxin-like protein
MQPLPHHYKVTVSASDSAEVEISSQGLTSIRSAPPAEFGGPGTLWSPETLLVAAAADCFVLTFRAVAAASRLNWTSMVCKAHGTVDRADGVTRFTAIELHARLLLPARDELEKAHRVLDKAEKACLVGNSLSCQPKLVAEVSVEEPALACAI